MPQKPHGIIHPVLDCDNTIGQKVPMKDYIEVTATMHDGHIEKGILDIPQIFLVHWIRKYFQDNLRPS